MSRFLALDWDHDKIHLLAVSLSRNKVQVENVASWDEPCTQDAAVLQAAGARLREHLRQAKMAAAPVLGCLGREHVILKELRYPAVEEAQEPQLVRFQAGKELTEPINHFVLDYAPLPGGTPREKRAFVVALRKPLAGAWQTLCKNAGLKLALLTTRPFGVAAALEQITGAQGKTVAALVAHADWAEFLVARGGQVLFARTLPAECDLLAEVRRNLALYNGQARGPGEPVQALYLAVDRDQESLRERLELLLAIPVRDLEPQGLSDHPNMLAAPASHVALLGLAQRWGREQKAPINLAAPKEPRVQTGGKRERMVLQVGLVALLLIVLTFLALWKRNSTQTELAALKGQITSIETQLEKLKPAQQQFVQMKQWERGALPWLDEFYDLTADFPDQKGFRVNSLTLTPLSGAAAEKYAMRMTIIGVVPEDHNQLVDVLVDRINRRGNSKASRETLQHGSNKKEDTQEFTLHVDVIRQDLKKYIPRPVVPPAVNPGQKGKGREDRLVNASSEGEHHE